MTRALVITTLALGALAVACASSTDKPKANAGSGGGSGGSISATGGNGGTPGTGGMVSAGGTGGSGSGGDSGSGGAASGGSGGGGVTDGPADQPQDASWADGASSTSGDGGWTPSGIPAPDGKAGIYACKKEWTQQQCCAFLCECIDHICSDTPMGKITNCMAMCNGLSAARARCQVYHCFESNSASGKGDHDSHCGHASGKLGGGGCPAYTN